MQPVHVVTDLSETPMRCLLQRVPQFVGMKAPLVFGMSESSSKTRDMTGGEAAPAVEEEEADTEASVVAGVAAAFPRCIFVSSAVVARSARGSVTGAAVCLWWWRRESEQGGLQEWSASRT